jgi:hypothetical protein
MSKKRSSGSKVKTEPPNKFAIGSGSRPSGGKHRIPESHPRDKLGLDGRKTKGAL